MKLLGRTTQPGDIDQCLSFVRDRFLYGKDQLPLLRSLWVDLLSRDIGRSAVVFDEAEPRSILAFGIAAPIERARFDQILRDRDAYISKSLLEEWLAGQEPFLNERQYADVNASPGLNVFVLHNGVSEAFHASSLTAILSKMAETFVEQYAGCQLSEIAHEPFGIPPEFGIDLGMQVIDYARRPTCEHPADREPSYIVLMTREDAERRPGNLTLNTLFLRFTPPLFNFNAIQRRLLRFAIEGESDVRIAEFLQTSPRTLKKRWAEIYLAMETVTGVQSGGSRGHRGAETRRHVLRYIRLHPEELHAYKTELPLARPAVVYP